MRHVYANIDLNHIFRASTVERISDRRGFGKKAILDVKVDVYSNGTYTIAEVKDETGLKGRRMRLA
jgi:hypothetical protein